MAGISLLSADVSMAQVADSTRSGQSGVDMPFVLPARTDTLRVVGGGPFLIRAFMETGSETVTVNDVKLGPGEYDLDARHGLIVIPGVAPDSSLTMIVGYRFVPLGLEASYRLWPFLDVGPAQPTSDGSRPPRSESSSLVTRGSITRGLLTGSNRNARIESGLQLQVEGEVAPGINLQAELTDEDTPLIPEGVTRQFDQFDRIRIGFESRHGRVDLGDFNAVLQKTRYGVLRRKLQGASVSTESLPVDSRLVNSVQVSAGAAISRGQFHSVDVAILDGVQGPYRLTGAAGERFILILPGSERVYLDGILLQPGVGQDYVLDYALGELTFTARHVMGRDRRVRIDYEYTTNRYTRTMTFTEASIGMGGSAGTPWATMTFGGIREADGDAFLDESGLTSADSVLIAMSIDGSVRIDGATRVTYDPEALYTQYVRQEVASGESIYRELTHVPGPDEPVFRVPFSFIGPGLGDYRRIPSQSGGISYEWVGEGQGAYIAARTLPVPSRKMLGEIRLRIEELPGLRFEAGVAGSSLDRNRLSPGNGSEVDGSMVDASIRTHALPLGGGWVAMADVSVQHRSAEFETFERVRPVEFIREWGLPVLSESPFGALLPGAGERLGEGTVRFARPDSSSISFGAGVLEVGEALRSRRREVAFHLNVLSRTQIRGSHQQLESEGSFPSSFRTARQFSRIRFQSSDVSSRWQPFVEGESDQWKLQGAGQLPGLVASQQSRRIPYISGRIGVTRTWAAHAVGVSGSIKQEDDLSIDGASLLTGSRIEVVQGDWEWEPTSRIRTSSLVGWRRARPNGADAAFPTDSAASESALLVGWEGQIRSGSVGTVRWNYDVRSEQTAALQEVFIRIGPERGNYVWQDVNEDGQIQLDEFFPETTPGEGEYAQTFFPSDSLESVTTAHARLGYTWMPVSSSPTWKRVSLATTVDVRETSRSSNRTDVYLLRPSALRQAGETVSGRVRLNQRLGLYPLRRDRDMIFSLLRVASLSELASGGESTEQSLAGLEIRDELVPDLDLTFEASVGNESSDSERFSTRSFDISRWEVRPGSVFRSGAWRFQTEWMFSHGTESASNATVRTHRVPLDAFWSRNQMNWRAGVEWSDSRISGGAPLGLQLFELTEGRGAGTSWMWHLHLDLQLTEIMSATLRYDGRSPTGRPPVHTGRFQLSARF